MATILFVSDKYAGDVKIFMGSVAYLYQINCSAGGLPKLPVPEAWITFKGMDGDRHRNRALHGGPDRALRLFSFEVLEALQHEGHTVHPGASGENLTVAGLNWTELKPGDLLKIGEEVQIKLTSYCEPCRHNAQWFVNGDFSRISHRQHPGWSRLYARVLSEGRVRQGDRVWIVTLPKRNMK
ncbi:MAG TPA: MOSC domain-containing protein [Nitrospirales bacterium]|nr:MOSC domain-containing protein [Nitrospirales bacterium]